MSIVHELATFIYYSPDKGMLPCDIWKILFREKSGLDPYESVFKNIRTAPKWKPLIRSFKPKDGQWLYGSTKIEEKSIVEDAKKKDRKEVEITVDIFERKHRFLFPSDKTECIKDYLLKSQTVLHFSCEEINGNLLFTIPSIEQIIKEYESCEIEYIKEVEDNAKI